MKITTKNIKQIEGLSIKQMITMQNAILKEIDKKLTAQEKGLLTIAFRLEHNLTLEENQ